MKKIIFLFFLLKSTKVVLNNLEKIKSLIIYTYKTKNVSFDFFSYEIYKRFNLEILSISNHQLTFISNFIGNEEKA